MIFPSWVQNVVFFDFRFGFLVENRTSSHLDGSGIPKSVIIQSYYKQNLVCLRNLNLGLTPPRMQPIPVVHHPGKRDAYARSCALCEGLHYHDLADDTQPSKVRSPHLAHVQVAPGHRVHTPWERLRFPPIRRVSRQSELACAAVLYEQDATPQCTTTAVRRRMRNRTL